jgi:hypothetical protein
MGIQRRRSPNRLEYSPNRRRTRSRLFGGRLIDMRGSPNCHSAHENQASDPTKWPNCHSAHENQASDPTKWPNCHSAHENQASHPTKWPNCHSAHENQASHPTKPRKELSLLSPFCRKVRLIVDREEIRRIKSAFLSLKGLLIVPPLTIRRAAPYLRAVLIVKFWPNRRSRGNQADQKRLSVAQGPPNCLSVDN